MKLDEIKKYHDMMLQHPGVRETIDNINAYFDELATVSEKHGQKLPPQMLCKSLIYLAGKIAFEVTPTLEEAFGMLFETLQIVKKTLEDLNDA
jgi:hypothetical protein